jgi:hypothetical protein
MTKLRCAYRRTPPSAERPTRTERHDGLCPAGHPFELTVYIIPSAGPLIVGAAESFTTCPTCCVALVETPASLRDRSDVEGWDVCTPEAAAFRRGKRGIETDPALAPLAFDEGRWARNQQEPRTTPEGAGAEYVDAWLAGWDHANEQLQIGMGPR